MLVLNRVYFTNGYVDQHELWLCVCVDLTVALFFFQVVSTVHVHTVTYTIYYVTYNN